MKLSRTVIHVYERDQRVVRPPGLSMGVSLHSHSECSREILDFLPGVARSIPLIATLFERSMAAYQRRHGQLLDFRSVYWRPPPAPAEVIASERDQVARRFNCGAFVSLTDHDTLDGPKRLRAIGRTDVPLSFEWSVPVEETVLHLGVHGISPERLDRLEPALAACTKGATDPSLGDLLDWIVEAPETFVVLNHPYWDLYRVGALRHESILLSFLRTHRSRIHALELNGYRRWSENRRVLPLAEGFALPVVGGGDRHGRSPNAIINLTSATSLAEFAHDLRAGRTTDCVVFPEYSDPFAARVLQGARDVLTHDPSRPGEGFVWGDRVFITVKGEEIPMASIWPTGGPWWLRGAVGVTRMLGSQSLRPLFRLALSGEHSVL